MNIQRLNAINRFPAEIIRRELIFSEHSAILIFRSEATLNYQLSIINYPLTEVGDLNNYEK